MPLEAQYVGKHALCICGKRVAAFVAYNTTSVHSRQGDSDFTIIELVVLMAWHILTTVGFIKRDRSCTCTHTVKVAWPWLHCLMGNCNSDYDTLAL